MVRPKVDDAAVASVAGETPASSDSSFVGYERIPVTTLPVDRALPFRLFTNLGGQPLLCLADGLVLDESRRDLGRESGGFWIADSDRSAYYSLLKSEIRQLLLPSDPDIEAASVRHYEIGQVAAKRLLTEPTSPEAADMAQEWVDSVRQLLAQDGGVLAQFGRILEVDPDLYQHSLHVCLYGLALARYAEITGDHGDFGVGLLLHDIGMLEISSETRARKGPLSCREWAQVRLHPARGVQKVAQAPWVGEIAKSVIRDHHEFLDGTGYPQGKSESELSPFVRIATIVNAFDRNTTERSFKKARSTPDALRDLIGRDPGRFDPRLLAAFVRMLQV